MHREDSPGLLEIARALDNFLSRWLTVPEDQIRLLAGYAKPCTFVRGAFLYREGDGADDLVLLMRGLVRAYCLRDGHEVNLRLLSAPAAALPYNSYLASVPADESLQALTPVSGYRLRFRDFCRDQPGLLAESLQRLLAERHFVALQRRLHMLQQRTAADRYRYFLQHMEPEVIKGTPSYHIATYLGITAESLSRIRHA